MTSDNMEEQRKAALDWHARSIAERPAEIMLSIGAAGESGVLVEAIEMLLENGYEARTILPATLFPGYSPFSLLKFVSLLLFDESADAALVLLRASGDREEARRVIDALDDPYFQQVRTRETIIAWLEAEELSDPGTTLPGSRGERTRI